MPSAEIIILADRRRPSDRALADHQAELLLAPYRFGLTAALFIVLGALAPFWGRR